MFPGRRASLERRRVRVLLVDDHDLFRTGLRSLLQQHGFRVTDAPSGEDAVRECRTCRPDVVVMDMNMPGMSGVESTRMLVAQHPRVAVLMLTVVADDEGVLAAIRAGASGYLLKSARLPEIVAGIEAAARGECVLAPRIAGALVTSVRTGPRPDAAVPDVDLTDRERQVLALITEGYDNAQIAARLYVSPSTVKNHISHVLEKLGLENRVQAAAFAIRSGLAGPA